MLRNSRTFQVKEFMVKLMEKISILGIRRSVQDQGVNQVSCSQMYWIRKENGIRLLKKGSFSVPQLERDNSVEGMSIGYIILDSRPAGMFCLSDVCRTGAKEALQQLKSLSIKTALLTGDSSAAANYAQVQVMTA